ncbi:MAG: hypothetical protein ABFS43_02670 [Thermodesulfobacteriota bacterium]
MNAIRVTRLVYLVYIAFLIIACSGTEIIEKQIDDTYTGKPVSNILIIAITGNEHNRKSFENKFVTHLHSIGVGAVSSEEVIPMPPDLEMGRETILETVNQYENDAVIITHLIDKDVKDVYTRGSKGYRGFHGFYRSRYSYNHDRGYSSTNTTLRLETNLYDVKTDNLIWSGESKTWSKDTGDQIINDVVKALIDTLYENELIAPAP